MEDINTEVIDSQDDTQTVTEETNTTLTVDDYNQLMLEKKALEEKNAKLYARIKKEKAEKPLVETQNPQLIQELTRLKLKVDHGISDPEAIDFVMKNGGEKALENPYIKSAIDAIVKQKNAEQAVVEQESGKSEVERKYSVQQLKDMPSEELEKILPHA